MRELGFSKMWPKLQQDTFTTFRFTRKDKDWVVDEVIKVVFKSRSHDHRKVLGVAEIVGKEARKMPWGLCRVKAPLVTDEEATTDGFPATEGKPAYYTMWEFLWKAYGFDRLYKEPMNKLTLRWKERA